MNEIEQKQYLKQYLKDIRIIQMNMDKINISTEQLLGTKLTINPLKIKRINTIRSKEYFKDLFKYNGISFQTKDEIKKLLKIHGFEIVEIDGYSSYTNINNNGDLVINKQKMKKIIRKLPYKAI